MLAPMKATAGRGLLSTPLPPLPPPRFASTTGGTCAFFSRRHCSRPPPSPLPTPLKLCGPPTGLVSQQKRLLLQTHEDLLHQDHSRVHKILRTIYYWPGMEATAEKFITKCQICQFNKNRRLHLKSSFVKRGIDELPLPRQQYGFDFYGVPKGEILVIVDLCTRETTLVFMSTRDQDKVAQAILNNVIFLKGVPTVLRGDSAPELVAGIVRDINKYLGISQVQTGGYNPRGNAICERANQTIGAMLRKCEDRHYKNVKNYLPAMAFAMNCTHSDALNCTPFEAGHGLPARTIAQARAHSAQVQFRAGGNDDMCVQDISKKSSMPASTRTPWN